MITCRISSAECHIDAAGLRLVNTKVIQGAESSENSVFKKPSLLKYYFAMVRS